MVMLMVNLIAYC